MKIYDLWTLNSMREYLENPPLEQHSDGGWYPLKPLTYSSPINRLRLAYLVLIGKAEAITWKHYPIENE